MAASTLYIIYIALIATSRVSLLTSFQPPLIQKNNNVTGHVSQEITTAYSSEPRGSKVTSSVVTGDDMCTRLEENKTLKDKLSMPSRLASA